MKAAAVFRGWTTERQRKQRRDPLYRVASMLLLACVVVALFSSTLALSAHDGEYSGTTVGSGVADAAALTMEVSAEGDSLRGTGANPAAAELPPHLEGISSVLSSGESMQVKEGGLDQRRLSTATAPHAAPVATAPASDDAHPESIPRHRGLITGAAAAGLGAHAAIAALQYGPHPRTPYPLLEVALKGFRLNTHNRGIYSFIAALVLFAFAIRKFLRSRNKRQRWLLDEMLRQDRLRVKELQAQQQAARLAALRQAARGGKN